MEDRLHHVQLNDHNGSLPRLEHPKKGLSCSHAPSKGHREHRLSDSSLSVKQTQSTGGKEGLNEEGRLWDLGFNEVRPIPQLGLLVHDRHELPMVDLSPDFILFVLVLP